MAADAPGSPYLPSDGLSQQVQGTAMSGCPRQEVVARAYRDVFTRPDKQCLAPNKPDMRT